MNKTCKHCGSSEVYIEDTEDGPVRFLRCDVFPCIKETNVKINDYCIITKQPKNQYAYLVNQMCCVVSIEGNMCDVNSLGPYGSVTGCGTIPIDCLTVITREEYQARIAYRRGDSITTKEYISELRLKQIFNNNFNCYADTTDDSVVLAVDFEGFKKLLDIIQRQNLFVKQ